MWACSGSLTPLCIVDSLIGRIGGVGNDNISLRNLPPSPQYCISLKRRRGKKRKEKTRKWEVGRFLQLEVGILVSSIFWEPDANACLFISRGKNVISTLLLLWATNDLVAQVVLFMWTKQKPLKNVYLNISWVIKSEIIVKPDSPIHFCYFPFFFFFFFCQGGSWKKKSRNLRKVYPCNFIFFLQLYFLSKVCKRIFSAQGRNGYLNYYFSRKRLVLWKNGICYIGAFIINLPTSVFQRKLVYGNLWRGKEKYCLCI